jgi:hypothetical protein
MDDIRNILLGKAQEYLRGEIEEPVFRDEFNKAYGEYKTNMNANPDEKRRMADLLELLRSYMPDLTNNLNAFFPTVGLRNASAARVRADADKAELLGLIQANPRRQGGRRSSRKNRNRTKRMRRRHR